MRNGRSLALGCLLVVAEVLSAQELVPQPQPDPGPPKPPASPLGAPVPSPGPAPPYYPTPGPYPPAPGAPGLYAPPPPALESRFIASDPVGNPTLWLGVDGLIWWTQGQPLAVPLVTTGPTSQGAAAGNLGAPGTTSLNQPLQNGASGGVRFFAGGWLDSDHTVGLDGSLFILDQQSSGFGFTDRSGTGATVLNEPVIGAPFSTQVSAPGVETGAVLLRATTRFGGGDINGLFPLYRGKAWTANFLVGYRYLELDESLNLASNSELFTTTTYSDNMGNVLATATPGSSVLVRDRFSTRNQFNGGQVGSSFQYLWNRWSLSGAAKVAFGATHEVVTVNGTTTVFPVNGSPIPLSGGNFATLQVGRYAQNKFAVAPEIQLNLGYQITPLLRAQLGYSLMYLSSVARPGNQIDNTYDGVNHPAVPLATSSFWGQGLNVGLQLRF